MDASQLLAIKKARLLQSQKQAQNEKMISGQGRPNSYTYRDSSSLTSAIQGAPLLPQESQTLAEKKKKFEEDLKRENENTILVLLLGDGRVSTLEESIREAHKKSAYSSKQLRTTSMILTESYSGANLNSFDLVILYTKNNLMLEMNPELHFNNIFDEGKLEYHPDFGKCLNSYISKGGNLIMGSFCWGEEDPIPFFDYSTYSPFEYGGLSRYLENYQVKPENHVIFSENTEPFSTQITEIPLNIDKVLTTPKLTKDSQCIAKISETIPFVAVKETKNARLVAINSYIAFPYSGYQAKPVLIDIVYRSILWCNRLLG
jgi:hypothetical protein